MLQRRFHQSQTSLVTSLLAAVFSLSFSLTTAALAESVDGSVGEMFVFSRPSGAKNLGHVGWGYQTDRFPNLYCAGGVENPFNLPTIAAGNDIGYWQRCNLSYQGMLQEMRNRGYGKAKSLLVDPVYTFGAADFANNVIRTRGYSVIGANCADAARDVALQYGVSPYVIPSLVFYPAPNTWFGAFYASDGWVLTFL